MIIPLHFSAVDRQGTVGLDVVVGKAVVETGSIEREQLDRDDKGLRACGFEWNKQSHKR
jgi:hypothetical protein